MAELMYTGDIDNVAMAIGGHCTSELYSELESHETVCEVLGISTATKDLKDIIKQ